MKFSEIELPSNKKFGFFFTLIFAAVSAYFYNSENMILSFVFVVVSFIFLVITVMRAALLLPLNKLWMQFGFWLGRIISPLVLGIMFFGLFTPIATLMRLIGRDELRLKLSNKSSHWILRNEPIKSESFKKQF